MRNIGTITTNKQTTIATHSLLKKTCYVLKLIVIQTPFLEYNSLLVLKIFLISILSRDKLDVNNYFS